MNGSTLALVTGLATGLTLIVAIGAQNAFVLRQGLAREHVGVVVALCSLSDAVLIVAGVAGVGVLVEQAGWLLEGVRWAGVAFLVGYAVLSLRRARRPGALDPTAVERPRGRRRAVLTALALTWLNPHVYLDTVLFLGSVGAAQGADRWWFAAGAVVASLVWFTGLGVGARAAHRLLARPRSWQVLDALIGLTMLAVAVLLARADLG